MCALCSVCHEKQAILVNWVSIKTCELGIDINNTVETLKRLGISQHELT